MSDLPERVLWYGVEAPLPERVHLRAGPLSLMLENGDLRYVRLGEREVLRRLYVAIRDHNWATAPNVITRLDIDDQGDAFRVTYDVDCRLGDIDFPWRGEITGDASGRIEFRFAGEARSLFLRNRIGFCILHPIRECAGKPAFVQTVDGLHEAGEFPLPIAPHQPMKDLLAMAHEAAPGVWAHVRFSGAVFEMEDQRNWTDASFKTYCTPLALRFPVKLTPGTRVRQSVTLTLSGETPPAASSAPSETVIRVGDDATPLPAIGLGVASHGQALSDREIARLAALRPAHLRVGLRLAGDDWRTALAQATEQARALDTALEAAIFVSDDAPAVLAALAAAIERLAPRVARWLVFHESEISTSERWPRLAREHLQRFGAPVGGGTNAYFTELNRERPPIDALDLVCYSINPQVHAFDNASLAETLEAQAATVESARQFIADLPLAISPVTLRPRFNPNATGPEPAPTADELPSQVDPRQMSLFAAGWTLGSIKYLAQSGVASVTYFETTGWRGVMETEAGSPLPERFRSLAGGVFPLYHVLADVADFAGGEVLASESSAPLAVEALVLRRDARRRLLLANVTDTEQPVRVEGVDLAGATVRVLDASNAEAAMRDPEAWRAQDGVPLAGETITLPPYAVARLDVRP